MADTRRSHLRLVRDGEVPYPDRGSEGQEVLARKLTAVARAAGIRTAGSEGEEDEIPPRSSASTTHLQLRFCDPDASQLPDRRAALLSRSMESFAADPILLESFRSLQAFLEGLSLKGELGAVATLSTESGSSPKALSAYREAVRHLFKTTGMLAVDPSFLYRSVVDRGDRGPAAWANEYSVCVRNLFTRKGFEGLWDHRTTFKTDSACVRVGVSFCRSSVEGGVDVQGMKLCFCLPPDRWEGGQIGVYFDEASGLRRPAANNILMVKR